VTLSVPTAPIGAGNETLFLTTGDVSYEVDLTVVEPDPATGVLTGIVTNSTGVPVSAIEFAVLNAQTGAQAFVTPNAAGNYTVELTAGIYDIVIDQPGYEFRTIGGISISENETTVRDIVLNETLDGSDTTPPTITDMQAIDRTDRDGVVSGGDLVEVRAFVSDFESGVQDVLAFPRAFGVDQVVLTNENGDLYNATFRVAENGTAPDDVYLIPITAIDGAPNVANATTGLLELNTTESNPLRLTNATAIDRENDDGSVSDGDLVEIRVEITGVEGGINRTGAIADPFGVLDVPLTPAGGDVYNGTLRVNGSAAFQQSGEYRIYVSARDQAGNENSTFTNRLFLNTSTTPGDSTPPALTNAQAIDRENDDGTVSDGDLVEIRATVTDAGSGVSRVGAIPEQFGVEEVTLTNAGGDIYNATFEVNESVASRTGANYEVYVFAEDGAGNVNQTFTNALRLNGSTTPSDTTPPSLANVSATNLNGTTGDVRDGDVIRISATVTDDESGVTEVYASVARLGGPEELVMTDDGSGTYVGEFAVNASSPMIEESGSAVLASVTALDGAGNGDTAFTSELTLNYSTGSDDTTCVKRAVAGPDGTLTLPELQSAINRWAEDQAVPDTGGKTLTLPKLQSLINAWAEDQPVAC
jgi:hypothetical protein